MRFPRILFYCLLLFLGGCNPIVDRSKEEAPKVSPYQNEDRNLQKMRQKKDSIPRSPHKKKKLRAIDTLKPKTASLGSLQKQQITSDLKYRIT